MVVSDAEERKARRDVLGVIFQEVIVGSRCSDVMEGNEI